MLLSLVDPRDFRFKRRRYGPVEEVGVDRLGLVLDWVRGVPLKNLADTYLSEVQGGDEDYVLGPDMVPVEPKPPALL